MKVFITGGTGLVGTNVVRELLLSGHSVLALSRSDASDTKLKAAGAEVHHGSMEDLESIKDGVKMADAVIHCAFPHDFDKFAEGCATEVKVIEAIGAALGHGSKKPFIITSGTALLDKPAHGPCDEDSPSTSPFPRNGTRVAFEKLIIEDDLDIRVVRLAPCVHGTNDVKGFIPMFIKTSKEQGAAYYPDEGANVWPAVDVRDAARLYVAALEKGRKGRSYHAIGDTGVSLKSIFGMIAKKLGIEAVSKDVPFLNDLLGFYAIILQIDNPCSAEITKKELGWEAKEPGLLADMESGGWYFEN